MSSTVLVYPARRVGRATLTTGAALTVWLVLVVVLGAAGAFVTPAGQAPLRILIGATAPIVVFLSAFSSRRFRDFVAAADLRLLAAIQAWRFGGLGFLALYANGVLPGMFAWPAGLGDMAIGITAPWILVALVRHPRFATSRTFMTWNVLGILDLVVAVSMGALSSGLATGVAGEITTGPMSRLPLVLVPAYFVPLFVMLHLAALLQARRVGTRVSFEIDAGDALPKRVA